MSENGQSFGGFPRRGLQLLAELAANNNRAWFEAHKAELQTQLLSPAQAFVLALGARTSYFADQFGDYWRGIESNWGQLRQIAEGAVAVRALILMGAVHPTVAQQIVSGAERDTFVRTVVAVEQLRSQGTITPDGEGFLILRQAGAAALEALPRSSGTR